MQLQSIVVSKLVMMLSPFIDLSKGWVLTSRKVQLHNLSTTNDVMLKEYNLNTQCSIYIAKAKMRV